MTAVYPIDDNNIERKWRYAAQTFYEVSGKLRVRKKKVEGKNVLSIEIAKTQDQFKTLWSSPIYNAGDYGTKLLTNMGFRKSDFKFPKSVFTTLDCIYAVSDNDSVILDYFAGSGTTAHAVIRLNRRDKESHRKYILTEMGEYFYSVTKPRVLKALYSDQWKNGIPTDWKDGVSQIVKYIHIESYEDALNNISLSDSDRDIFGSEDYLVNYMFSRESTESMMNTRQFKEPFNTKMSVTERNERRTKRVDIIGTFSYLIGLKVELQSDVSLYSVDIVEGRYRVAEALEESGRMYKFQHLVGRLPDRRRALVIWRSISDDILESNEALYEYFLKTDFGVDKRELEVLYVNGDSSLESYRQSSEHWVVMLTDLEFVDRMWKE